MPVEVSWWAQERFGSGELGTPLVCESAHLRDFYLETLFGYRTVSGRARIMSDKPWFSNGLRFECQRCGRCCTNRGGYAFVYLTEADTARLAGFLGLERDEFVARHCEEVEGRVTLRTDSPQCAFLREDRTCAVHPARPHQCRSWPFWRENLEAATWRREIEPLCPGLGQGPLHTAEEIEAIARRDEEWYGG